MGLNSLLVKLFRPLSPIITVTSEKMASEVVEKGRLYANKGRNVFVACKDQGSCPTINVMSDSDSIKFKDDYSKGLRMPKAFVKFIFR